MHVIFLPLPFQKIHKLYIYIKEKRIDREFAKKILEMEKYTTELKISTEGRVTD